MYKTECDFNVSLEKSADRDAVADLADTEKERTRSKPTPSKPRDGQHKGAPYLKNSFIHAVVKGRSSFFLSAV